MILSKQGKNLIKHFEGLRLNAYRDSAGIWTIGYGSTRYQDGRAIKPDDKLPNEFQADALFEDTLRKYVNAVNEFVKVELTQNQFDALVSFTYNEGTSALKGSTLLNKLNAGDCPATADQFLVWNKITNPTTGQKIVLDALVKRRQRERQLFLSTENLHDGD